MEIPIIRVCDQNPPIISGSYEVWARSAARGARAPRAALGRGLGKSLGWARRRGEDLYRLSGSDREHV